MNVTVKNADAAAAVLRLKSNRILIDLHALMPEIALFLEAETKNSIAGRRDEQRSVDTGRFMQSVSSTTNSGDNTESAIVYSDVEYAKYLEYGTSKIGARSHFRNTLERNTDTVTNMVADVVKRV